MFYMSSHSKNATKFYMSSHDNLWLGFNLEVGATIHGAEVSTVNHGADLWPRQRQRRQPRQP